MVLRVKPTPTRFPTNGLNTPMDNTPLHSISSLCHPWDALLVFMWGAIDSIRSGTSDRSHSAATNFTASLYTFSKAWESLSRLVHGEENTGIRFPEGRFGLTSVPQTISVTLTMLYFLLNLVFKKISMSRPGGWVPGEVRDI